MLSPRVRIARERFLSGSARFRKLGFIEYNGGIQINEALLSVVLHE
jgi:hypothetical protein